MGQTLLEKVWDLHTVRRLPNGQTQLFVGLHLIHEVTTPQAFDMLRQRGIGVAFPERTYATVDHIVPTRDQQRPFADDLAEAMLLKGVAVGTTLAFMMSIAAISLPELLILRKVIKWQALALFTGIVTVSIIFIGIVFNIILGS